MAKMLDTLRKTVQKSNESRYRIAHGSGVAASQLARLVSGERGLSIESAEKLVDYLELEIIIRPKRRRRKAK